METQIELIFFDIKDHSNVRLAKFIGDLDATNVESILEQITNLRNDGITKIVADFEKLRYVNSTGLGILLHLSKIAKESDGFFKIANVNENVYEIIEIIGAATLLEIYDTVDDAVASINA